MVKQDYQGQIVWIIGASSGIGAALACELAGRGAVLALSARSHDKLEQLQQSLGKAHKVFPLDVTDNVAVQGAADKVKAAFGHIDRIVFLAAAYTPMKIDTLDLAATQDIIAINLMGAFNLVQAALPLLKAQGNKGQLALCGSVAGYIGLPGGQPYSATKAAIINLAETLRAECGDVIDIRLISPGFVRTPLTDKNNFQMPLMIETEQAGTEIADGLLSRRFEIHFPPKFTAILKILQLLPYALTLRLTRRLKV